MARKKASISSFIFGMVFGILLLIGAVAYLGYWAYTQLTVDKFEELSKQEVTFIGEDSELRTLTIEGLVKQAKDIPEMSFGEFAEQYEIEFPTEISQIITALDDVKIKEISAQNILERVKIGVVLGAPYNDFETYGDDYTGEMPDGAETLMWEFRSYTIAGETGVSTYIDNLNIGKIKSVFNLSFPSFINIPDETKLDELGEAIEGMTVASFIDSMFEEGESATGMSGSIIEAMKTMKNTDGEFYTLGEFGALFNALPSNILLADIVEEPEATETTPIATILRKLLKYENSAHATDPTAPEYLYYNLGEINTVFDQLDQKIFLADIIKEPEATENDPIDKILRKLLKKENPVHATDPTAPEYLYNTLADIDTVFGELDQNILLSDIIEEPASTDTTPIAAILRKLLKKENPVHATNSTAPEYLYNTLADIDTVFGELDERVLLSDIIAEPGSSANEPVDKILRKVLKSENPAYATDPTKPQYIYHNLADVNTVFSGLGDRILLVDVISEPASTDTSPVAAILRKVLKDADSGVYHTLNDADDVFGELGDDILLTDIITEPDASDTTPMAAILRKVLKNEGGVPYTINNINTAFDGLGTRLLLTDIITEPDASDTTPMAAILRKVLKNEGGVPYNINNIDDAFDGLGTRLLLTDIITEPDASDTTPMAAILRKVLKDEGGVPYNINNIDDAFDSLGTRLLLTDIITEPAASDTTPMAAILRKVLKDEGGVPYNINNINTAFDSLGTRLLLTDIITEPAASDTTPMAAILRKVLKDEGGVSYNLNNINTAFDTLGDRLFLKEIINEPANTDTPMNVIISKLLIKNSAATLDSQKYYTLNEMNEVFGNLGTRVLIREIITAPAADGSISSNIINKIREMKDGSDNYYSLNNMNLALAGLPANLTIPELIPMPADPTSPAAKIIGYMSEDKPTGGKYNLTEMPDAVSYAIDSLNIGDLFGASPTTGIPALLGADTKIMDIGGAEVANKITGATLQELYEAGIISDAPSNKIKDKTIEDLIDFMEAYSHLLP